MLLFALQDNQVPVCPLCNTPIPVKKGELPDVRVGEHIDNDCQSDPAKEKRKVCVQRSNTGWQSMLLVCVLHVRGNSGDMYDTEWYVERVVLAVLRELDAEML